MYVWFALMPDWVPEIWFLGTYVPGISRKIGFKRQVEKGFSSIFCQIFDIHTNFDDLSKFCCVFCTLHFGKLPKIWQKMEKSLVQLTLNSFLHGHFKNLGFRFWVPGTWSITKMHCIKNYPVTKNNPMNRDVVYVCHLN